MHPHDILSALDFMELRRERIEAIADPFKSEGTGLTVPTELRATMDAINTEMRTQADRARARDEDLVEIHLPSGPALVELIRWGAKRQDLFNTLTKVTMSPDEYEGPLGLLRNLIGSAVAQLPPESPAAQT